MVKDIANSVRGRPGVRFPGRSNRDIVSPTARHRCDVSKEPCCLNAKLRKWAPPLVRRFGVTPQKYGEDQIFLEVSVYSCTSNRKNKSFRFKCKTNAIQKNSAVHRETTKKQDAYRAMATLFHPIAQNSV